jgi:hypothetical protein
MGRKIRQNLDFLVVRDDLVEGHKGLSVLL